MSLVENLISQISSSSIGGAFKPQSFDMNDLTFANLLGKQLNSLAENAQADITKQLGAPAGMIIEPFDNSSITEVSETQKTEDSPDTIKIQDLKTDNFFSTLLSNDSNNNVMNYAKKHATNAYNVFSKSYVSSLSDFVGDITALAQ